MDQTEEQKPNEMSVDHRKSSNNKRYELGFHLAIDWRYLFIIPILLLIIYFSSANAVAYQNISHSNDNVIQNGNYRFEARIKKADSKLNSLESPSFNNNENIGDDLNLNKNETDDFNINAATEDAFTENYTDFSIDETSTEGDNINILKTVSPKGNVDIVVKCSLPDGINGTDCSSVGSEVLEPTNKTFDISEGLEHSSTQRRGKVIFENVSESTSTLSYQTSVSSNETLEIYNHNYSTTFSSIVRSIQTTERSVIISETSTMNLSDIHSLSSVHFDSTNYTGNQSQTYNIADFNDTSIEKNNMTLHSVNVLNITKNDEVTTEENYDTKPCLNNTNSDENNMKDIKTDDKNQSNVLKSINNQSDEVTTEEDYNASYEIEEDDVQEQTSQRAQEEPLSFAPLNALRDLAGSFVESLYERLVPQNVRDIINRLQNQNDKLETIKLRSREENGGLGQFGRSILKGLSEPLTQLMQGVRDYGSLDSDKNFFAGVASSVVSVADSVSESFKDRVRAIYPGTLWCGDGDMARSAEVGLFFMTDSCCRKHDACKLYIPAGATKYGLTNTGIFTRSHCECDRAFSRCLKRTNSLVSSQIGLTYFSILGPQCFKREHPIIRCKRKTRYTGQKCEEYELDYKQPKMWQWFDNETF